ncbi:PKD domain-containing protein [Lentzea sp. NPDC005914]|uniref:PKD domain-containing protein n=1 Tax=Lentzea sp. NPDC005914 TaxID=3154572 RepID=UPI00340F1E86
MRTGWLSRRGSAALLAVGAGTVIGVMLLVGARNGHPAQDVRLLPGSAWLASAQVGQVALLDGSSAEIAAQVKVAAPGDPIDVVQQGSTAFVVNRGSGVVTRVDGGAFTVSAPVSPIPDARDGLRSFAGPDALYALDTERGVLSAMEATSLAPRGQPLPLAAKLADGGATLDSSGTLWVIDDSTGDLTMVSGSERTTRRQATQAGRGKLTLVNDTVVLVDTGARTATMLDRSTGEPNSAVSLDLRPDDQVTISGSPHDDRLYLITSRGVLTICDMANSTECSTVVPLSAADNDLGAAVEAGHYVLVPDYTTGRVWIVDLNDNRVLPSQPVLTPPGPFQLITRDGVVFYNDPNSERAGVLRLDGTVRPAAKYDAADPDKGLNTPPPSAPLQSTIATSAPTTQGNQPPPTQQTAAQQPIPTTGRRPGPVTAGTTAVTTRPTTVPSTPVLRVTLSKTTAEVGENVTMQVSTTQGEAPIKAQWDFGDTSTGSGVTVPHRWSAARTYQVSVQATMSDGGQATTSVSVQITDVPTVRLTISVQGQGHVIAAGGRPCPPQCAIDVNRGTNITIDAYPSADHRFDRWSGACSGGTPTCALRMDAPANVIATFADLAEPEDCIPYDPARLSLRQFSADDWRLIGFTRGGAEMFMARFYNQIDANNGLLVARGFDQQCFVGRGTDMISPYWKGGSGQAGSVSPEDCIGYRAGNLTIVETNDSFGHWWSVRDGGLFMFAARTEPQAIRIKREAQQWSRACYIGRSSGPIGAETAYFR